MAITKSAPGGAFKGKLDNAVFAPWKGLLTVRSVPKKSSKKAVQSQIEQRAKFALMGQFVARLAEVITMGYQSVSGNVTAHNVALKENLATALIGEYPDYAIDYAKVKLSRTSGSNEINGISNVLTTAAINGKVTITWIAEDATRQKTLPTDVLCVIFYNATQKFFMTSGKAAIRSALTTSVRIPLEEDTDVIHGWVLIFSADGKNVSRSTYLGIIDA